MYLRTRIATKMVVWETLVLITHLLETPPFRTTLNNLLFKNDEGTPKTRLIMRHRLRMLVRPQYSNSQNLQVATSDGSRVETIIWNQRGGDIFYVA